MPEWGFRTKDCFREQWAPLYRETCPLRPTQVPHLPEFSQLCGVWSWGGLRPQIPNISRQRREEWIWSWSERKSWFALEVVGDVGPGLPLWPLSGELMAFGRREIRISPQESEATRSPEPSPPTA